MNNSLIFPPFFFLMQVTRDILSQVLQSHIEHRWSEMSKTYWVKKALTKSKMSQTGHILKWVDKIQDLIISHMTLSVKLWRQLLALNKRLQNSQGHSKHLTTTSISLTNLQVYRCTIFSKAKGNHYNIQMNYLNIFCLTCKKVSF